jgi:hypothetical protein
MTNKNSAYTRDRNGNAARNVVSESQADWRGNYPNTWYLPWSGTAGAADNAVIYQIDDASMYNYHTFTASGTSGCDVEVSHDGTTWNVIAVQLTSDVTTGGGIKVITIPTGSTAFLHGKFKHIRVLEDGATDANCVGAHSVI